MNSSSCAECQAIFAELRNLRKGDLEPKGDLIEWRKRLREWRSDLTEEDRLNMTKAWIRLQEHRKLTGHLTSLGQLPPGAFSNPN